MRSFELGCAKRDANLEKRSISKVNSRSKGKNGTFPQFPTPRKSLIKRLKMPMQAQHCDSPHIIYTSCVSTPRQRCAFGNLRLPFAKPFPAETGRLLPPSCSIYFYMIPIFYFIFLTPLQHFKALPDFSSTPVGFRLFSVQLPSPPCSAHLPQGNVHACCVHNTSNWVTYRLNLLHATHVLTLLTCV